jgi:hypothetical protein
LDAMKRSCDHASTVSRKIIALAFVSMRLG